jgi:endo-1,4-beta-xylanase
VQSSWNVSRHLKIRTLGCGIFALCLALSASSAESLREAAQRSGVLIGAAARPARLIEPAYAATLARDFNMLEPEDAMKWEVLRPGPETFDFTQADQLVDFAHRHNMKVRGHTLVWHRQNPAWLTEGHFTRAQLAKLLETHIKTVVGHYRGKIFAWDVVNEALDEGARAGKLRGTIWYDQPGIGSAGQGADYLAQCFRWAHQADPGALLFYNEAEADEVNTKSDALYTMVREFIRQRVPIDGIGLQMHIGNGHPDIPSISANIARFTALGLQVHITELDVSVPVNSDGNASPADLQRQAEIYRQITAACLSHPGCSAIQTWGFTDKYSWIGSRPKKTRGRALLFDRDYQPKPAYRAMYEALSKGR